MLAIIDYGTGNLRSVEKAFESLGHDVIVTSDKKQMEACEKLVLPGVGAFGHCMNYLKEKGLDKFIIEWVNSGRPYLGICLGMQILFDSSNEQGEYRGLGIIKGTVERFSDDVKVPQIGWNLVKFNGKASFEVSNSYYYFVHSYYCQPENEAVKWAETTYGIPYCAGLIKDNLIAVQFHPEKSSKAGLELLDNYARS